MHCTVLLWEQYNVKFLWFFFPIWLAKEANVANNDKQIANEPMNSLFFPEEQLVRVVYDTSTTHHEPWGHTAVTGSYCWHSSNWSGINPALET
jgi:hypothetical protein